MGRDARANQARQAKRLETLQADLETIYRALPALQCQGKCTDSCGPINWGEYEARLVTKVAGRPPTFDAKLRCTYLNAEGRCEVYDLRPLICRLFGMVKKMRCPFGCEPERWVTDEEARTLFMKAHILVGQYRELRPAPDVPKWMHEAFARIAIGEQERMRKMFAPVAHVAEASGSKPDQGGFDSRSGHQCQDCGYESQDRGHGHTADFWHHMMTVHQKGPGVLDDGSLSRSMGKRLTVMKKARANDGEVPGTG